jgi:purine-binding chemotaxis protein CheW
MCAVVLFSLADQQYSLDVSHVQEVVRMVAMTRVPDAPPEILGAINVHGSATLVMDLRQRFGLPRMAPPLPLW